MFQNPFSRIFDGQRYHIILAPGQCCYNALFLSVVSTIRYPKLVSFAYISFYFSVAIETVVVWFTCFLCVFQEVNF